MRTKVILGLAALAAGAFTCVAQTTVYSLNIVGYVNVPVAANKLALIANPLKPSNGNYNITNTITLPDAADGANIFTWAGTGWNSVVPQWYAGGGWFPDTTIPLGDAFFINSPVAATVTFVGEVATGDIAYSYPKGFSVVANKVPVAENFPGAAHGNDGDNIYTWNGTAYDSTVWQYYAGAGWDNGSQPGNSTNGPLLPVGTGIVYANNGTAPVTWTRTFNP